MEVTSFSYRALPDACEGQTKIPSRWGSFNTEAAGNDKLSESKTENSFDRWFVFPLMLYIKLLSLMH